MLREQTLLETPHLTVVQESIATSARPEGTEWLNVRRKQAAVIAPRTVDGRFVLIHQERIPARRILWEFPAGQIDGEVTEASIRATALRELAEETGYAPQDNALDSLGGYFASPGFTNEYMHLFLARDVVTLPQGHAPEESERILEVRVFPLQEIIEMIRKGEIQDANTLCLVAKMFSMNLLTL
ncbi:MAG: NUDIX hydrolase [Chthoniobacterales bacterium]